MPQPETAPPRDRFVAFAFAGADLLIETGIDGVISFAAGAFRQRMGIEPEEVIGRHLRQLVAPADRIALDVALAGLGAGGRVLPMLVRLNNTARSPATFAALLVPSLPPRVCVTVGPVPTATEVAADEADDPRSFGREAEARLRDGGAGELALLEVSNWPQVREQLSGEDQRTLRAGIAGSFGPAGGAGAAHEMGEGRYGVLVAESDTVANLVGRLDKVVRGSPAGHMARVDGIGLPLGAGSLQPSQAARALRYALSQFRTGGMEAARLVAGSGSLAGVLTTVAGQAKMLRAAILERKFQLKYQPVVTLADRRVHHYEALLRPFAPLIANSQTTQDFVVSVEAMGLTDELDTAVTEMALRTLQDTPGVSIAVNVSGLSIQSDAFQHKMMKMLANPALGGPSSARRLLVELTETVEIDDMTTAATNIAELRSVGVRVCLDDFGAGAAAFRYLREFPVDFVKIDGLYVRRAPLGGRERSFVTSMVDLAAAVGARVIAEMIETEEQAQLMHLIGVEFGQGWLFGRPGALPGATR